MNEGDLVLGHYGEFPAIASLQPTGHRTSGGASQLEPRITRAVRSEREQVPIDNDRVFVSNSRTRLLGLQHLTQFAKQTCAVSFPGCTVHARQQRGAGGGELLG